MPDLIVISSYPEKDITHSSKTVGGASYTKQLVIGLINQTPTTDITVWAEYFEKLESYLELKTKVERNWHRGDFLSVLQLSWNVATTPTPRILLSFEAYMFGSVVLSFPIFLGLLLARLRGVQTYTLLHQVPDSLQEYVAHPFVRFVMEAGKRFLFWLISISNTQVIVFEEQLRKQFGYEKKTVVLSHFIPEVPVKDKRAARKKIGWKTDQLYCLYLGYLAPYKGVDWLVKNWPVESTYQLVIGGGINPNHHENAAIHTLISTIEKHAAEKQIPVTGFIPEELLHDYLAACDLVILPYTSFLSSSGPLSLALAHLQPVLLSQPLAVYTASPDFQGALSKSQLTTDDVTFTLTAESLKTKLANVQHKSKQFTVFAKELTQLRSVSAISQNLQNLLHLEER